MTPRQVVAVYLHPRDDHGNVAVGYGGGSDRRAVRGQWVRHLLWLGITPTPELVARCEATNGV